MNMETRRRYSILDRFIAELDDSVRALTLRAPAGARPSPARKADAINLSPDRARLSAALMRVNHAGEVAAQALYLGQGMTASGHRARDMLRDSAREEIDHLNWCRQRLVELESRPSLLDPAWFAGAFCLGALAGCAGDRWSLGFVAETERQVVRHLDGHLHRLPPEDLKSRAILEQMRRDEGRHAATAMESGAVDLPPIIRRVMALGARVMTGTAYWV